MTPVPPLCELNSLYLLNVLLWFCALKVLLCSQGCVAVQNDESLLLKAPKESQNMKTAERGITQSMHKFSFTKVSEVGSLQIPTFSYSPFVFIVGLITSWISKLNNNVVKN